MSTSIDDFVFPVNEIILDTFGTGPPGPTGPTGPPGATGETGAAGTTGSYVNVKDWGALGNGVVDDTVGIQNAYAAAVAAGVKALYFPAGTYLVIPDANGVILSIRSTDFTFFGAGQSVSKIKVANGAGDYMAVISDGVYVGSSFFDLSGFQFHDMCIDGNSQNNPISDVSFTGPLYTGFPRLAIRSYKGYYGSIYNARFTNFDNVNTIAINGGASITGVWTIRNSVFDFTGYGTSHDHSTIYFHGDNVFITNNTFLGAGDAAITAIETHGPNQVVTGNFIRDYFTMANITGVSADNSYNCTMSSNHGQRCGIGIALWAYDYGGIVGYAVDSAIISENNIEIDYDRWSFATAYRTGITLYISSTGLCRNVKIINNNIRYAPYSDTPVSNDNHSAGISWWRASGVTEGTEEVDIEISGNTITGPLGLGIHYEPNILSSRVKIRNNTVTNPGNGCPSSAYANGVRVNLGALGLSDILISGNRVIDTRGTHLITKGFDFSSTSVVTAGRAFDNTVRCVDGTRLATYSLHTTPVWSLGPEMTSYQQRYASARYYTTPSSSRTTAALTQDTLYLVKFTVGTANTFDRIGVNVTVTPGTTVMRLGLWYTEDVDLPGKLIADYGTVSAATTGFKEITISQYLEAGVYWLGTVPQSGGATVTAINQTHFTTGHPTAATLIASDYSALITAATFTGALTSSPTIANLGAFGPLILLRST